MGNKNNNTPLVVILYLIIGGSSFEIIRDLWQNAPDKKTAFWQTLIVIIGVAFLSILIQVIQGIKDGIVERLNIKLRNRIFSIFDRNEQKFLQFMEGDLRHLEFRGIGKTELDRFLYIKDAFIPLDFTRKLEKDNSFSNEEVSDILSTSRISESVVFEELLSLAVNTRLQVIVIGKPGSGKSTLIQYIAHMAASNRMKFFRGSKKLSKIPFIVKLREYGEKIIVENLSLSDVIRSSYDRKQLDLPKEWYEEKIKSRSCLVLIDGLDEVADEKSRVKIARWVQNNINIYNKCSFLITSRPHGMTAESKISGIDELEIADLSDNQVRVFISQWHIANRMRKIPVDTVQEMDEANLNRAKRTADELIRKLIGNPLYGRIITNPLLLTMIIVVDYLDRKLPGQRVELFKEMIDVSLNRRYREIDVDNEEKILEIYPVTKIQKQEVLEELGFRLMDMKRTEISLTDLLGFIDKALVVKNTQISKEKFLKVIEEEHGLFVETKIGFYEFSHKSFQEYLAASYVMKTKGEEYFYSKIDDVWWNETVRLYVASADGTFVLRKVREQELPSSEVLSLAIDTLDQAKNLNDSEKKEFEKWLDKTAKTATEEKRGLIAKAKLYSRIRGMQSLEGNLSIDQGLISNLEYQFFLDEMRKEDAYLYPDHWQTYAYSKDKDAEPVLGVRGEDATKFCEWLTDLDQNATVFELPQKNNLYRVHEEEQTFWVEEKINFSTNYHLHNPEKNHKTFSPEELSSRIIRDASLARGVLDANRRRNMAPVPIHILLARAPTVIPFSTGGTKYKTGTFMSNFEALSNQQFKEKIFLEKCEAFANEYKINLVDYVSRLNNLVATSAQQVVINEKWLEPIRNIYPFEFTSIKDHAEKFLTTCKNYKINRGVTSEQNYIIEELLSIVELLHTRDWDKKGNMTQAELMEIAKKDKEEGTSKYKDYDLKMVLLKPEKSDFVRWLIRVSITYLGTSIRNSLKTPEAMEARRNFLRDLTQFYLALMYLDAQVDEKYGFINGGIKIQMKDFRRG